MWRMTVLLVCTALTACLAVPVPSDPSAERRADTKIKTSITTKDQVIDVLGQPNIVGYPPDSIHYYGKTVPSKWCGMAIAFTPLIVPLPVLFCEESDRHAPWWLQIRFDDEGVVKSVDTKKGDAATEGYQAVRRAYLNDEANSGDLDAAFNLAKEFNDIGPLQQLAERGNVKAARLLAVEFNETQPLRKLAERGDTEVYALLYEVYVDMKYYDNKFREAWYWLCRSADGGYIQARTEVAWWFRKDNWNEIRTWGEITTDILGELGVTPDDRIAYMWFALAGDSPSAETFAERMDPADLKIAKQMVLDWKPGQCPSKEHPL